MNLLKKYYLFTLIYRICVRKYATLAQTLVFLSKLFIYFVVVTKIFSVSLEFSVRLTVTAL